MLISYGTKTKKIAFMIYFFTGFQFETFQDTLKVYPQNIENSLVWIYLKIIHTFYFSQNLPKTR